MGRRHPGPSASGVRGMAYLLLKNEPAAEKEFNALRAYLTPPLGEYMAGKYVDLERLRAAAYAGRSQEVTAGWQQLGGQFRPMTLPWRLAVLIWSWERCRRPSNTCGLR